MTRLRRITTIVAATAALAGRAEAQIPLDGYFIALRECPTTRAIRSTEDAVTTTVDRAYPLRGKNAADATHYYIDVKDASPQQRWVAVDCGVRVIRADGEAPPPAGPIRTAGPTPARTPGVGAGGGDAVFAVSWQPAFCETKPSKPECTSMTGDRFDATHLTLHGLWPQGVEYCGIAPAQKTLDQNKHWDQLTPVTLTPDTRDTLARVMPGTQSSLERHEWTRHGSCSGASAEKYFRSAVALVVALNESPVQGFLASRIGTTVQTNDIRAAFDQAFGGDAGSRVSFKCERDRDGDRNLITEMRIKLRGTVDETSDLGALILAAPKGPRECASGVLDPAGLQH